MIKKYDLSVNVEVESTSKIIKDMASILGDYSLQMGLIAQKMEATKDISYAGEALTCVSNCLSNLRIDLLATRPIRAYDRALEYAKAKEGE